MGLPLLKNKLSINTNVDNSVSILYANTRLVYYLMFGTLIVTTTLGFAYGLQTNIEIDSLDSFLHVICMASWPGVVTYPLIVYTATLRYRIIFTQQDIRVTYTCGITKHYSYDQVDYIEFLDSAKQLKLTAYLYSGTRLALVNELDNNQNEEISEKCLILADMIVDKSEASLVRI
ncbi:MAG: hypothetical protein SGJ04_08715 [Bacteroidota bacterium]|nr:hypothetical protein [Bacteroidota bacterium]